MKCVPHLVNPKSVALLTSYMNRIVSNDKHANDISNFPPLDDGTDIVSDSINNIEEGIIGSLTLDELSNGTNNDSDDQASLYSSFRSMIVSSTTSIISSVAVGGTPALNLLVGGGQMISDDTGTSSFATTGGAGASPTDLSATSRDN